MKTKQVNDSIAVEKPDNNEDTLLIEKPKNADLVRLRRKWICLTTLSDETIYIWNVNIKYFKTTNDSVVIFHDTGYGIESVGVKESIEYIFNAMAFADKSHREDGDYEV